MFTPSYGRFTTRAIQIYAHPQFNAASGFNDLAVVRVQLPFPFPHNTIDLVPRNNRVLADGTDCSFSGWGYNVVCLADINLYHFVKKIFVIQISLN